MPAWVLPLIFENKIKDEECPYCDELFKYQDSTYGGVAYYGIFYHHEYIVE